MSSSSNNRPLSSAERALAVWMLENGNPEAPGFLAQLADAEVTAWRCPCGCASINFQIKGSRRLRPAFTYLATFCAGRWTRLPVRSSTKVADC